MVRAKNGSSACFLLFACAAFHHWRFCASHNTPNSPMWPQASEWTALRTSLSLEASLIGPITNPKPYARECRKLSFSPIETLTGGDGLCMQSTKCIYEFCDESRGFAFPAYVADVRSDEDVVSILEFSKRHNITVSVKATGHSYQGASLAAGSILIFLRNFPKNDTVVENFVDSCGTNHGTAIGIAAGEIFDDIYRAIGDDYFFVAGASATVSLPGGWLQGSGLSSSSRQYGLGVDQVLDFRVVLADGKIKTVDACSDPDLFWALRGGGGGTFGVVTQINYKLYPATPITSVTFNPLGIFYPFLLPIFRTSISRFMEQLLQYWIGVSPSLDNRWGGLFSAERLILSFLGTVDEARETFLDDFDKWFDEVLEKPILLRLLGLSKPTVVQYNGLASLNNAAFSYLLGIYGPLGGIVEVIREAQVEGRAARLIPASVVQTKPTEVKDFLVSLATSSALPGGYFLGGQINAVPANATAVHPALRQVQYSIFTYGERANDMVRELFPNNMTGACFNHHNYLEPDWRNALWGQNYDKLVIIKEKYDPDHRFNPWHSVGYVGEEPEVRGDNASMLLDWIFWLVGLRFPLWG